MPDYVRIYTRQEYLTPGAAETVGMIAEAVRPSESTRLLDVASGKGEAAATLAGRFACRILCVDMFDPFIQYATAKFWFYNLRDLVSLVRADGKRLPVRDGSFDAAYCIGAPSIVGLEPGIQEMARAVRPGGRVIVSDLVWRSRPEPALGPEWRWLAEAEPKLSAAEYAAVIEGTGLRVERTHVHGPETWEEYWRPMLEVAHEAKTSQPADIFFADEVESDVELERLGVEKYVDYATFVASKAL